MLILLLVLQTNESSMSIVVVRLGMTTCDKLAEDADRMTHSGPLYKEQ